MLWCVRCVTRCPDLGVRLCQLARRRRISKRPEATPRQVTEAILPSHGVQCNAHGQAICGGHGSKQSSLCDARDVVNGSRCQRFENENPSGFLRAQPRYMYDLSDCGGVWCCVLLQTRKMKGGVCRRGVCQADCTFRFQNGKRSFVLTHLARAPQRGLRGNCVISAIKNQSQFWESGFTALDLL